MNQNQIRSAVNDALRPRNIIDQALDEITGRPALSRRALDRIVNEALVDGISAFELAAARDLVSESRGQALSLPTREAHARYDAYVAVEEAFKARASDFTLFVSGLIP